MNAADAAKFCTNCVHLCHYSIEKEYTLLFKMRNNLDTDIEDITVACQNWQISGHIMSLYIYIYIYIYMYR